MRWDLRMPGLPLKKDNNATEPTKDSEQEKTVSEGTEM